MTAIGVGVFAGFNMEWISIEKNTNEFFEDTDYADYRIYNEYGFGEEDIEKAEGRYMIKAKSSCLHRWPYRNGKEERVLAEQSGGTSLTYSDTDRVRVLYAVERRERADGGRRSAPPGAGKRPGPSGRKRAAAAASGSDRRKR